MDDVGEKTGFALERGHVTGLTRDPTADEMKLIDQLDPGRLRYREVSA
jgi:hypothetical protein